MVLERGDYAGAKNVTGGRLYVSPLRDIYPELWAEAPFERAVARELITMIGDGAQTTIEIAADSFTGEQPQSYTVLRARLDQWLAERAGEKGAMVVTKMRVDGAELARGRRTPARRRTARRGGRPRDRHPRRRRRDRRRRGRRGRGRAGTAGRRRRPARPSPRPKHHALGYKEVIELPAQTIEDRWHLNPGEGAAQLFMGAVTRGMMGGGFLYTNTESIALGIVVGMEQMRSRGDELESWQLLDEFKELPQIRPLVAGGTVAEYSAHAVAEGGIAQVPKLFGDGYVLAGDVAGLSLNALVTVRGMDFAIASGYHAAQAIIAAKKAGDTSGRRPGRLRGAPAPELRAARSRNEPRHPRHHRERAPVHALSARRLAAARGGLHDRPRPAAQGSAARPGRRVRRDFLNVATAKDLWSLRGM